MARSDSADVELVTLRGPKDALPAWALGESHQRIDGSIPPYLTFVSDAAWLSDGSVMLVDGLSRQLHLFDSDGAYVRTLAEPGEGPGELGSVSTLSVVGSDSVLVWDPRNRRMSVFHPVMGLVRSFPVIGRDSGRIAEMWSAGPDQLLSLRSMEGANPPNGPYPRRHPRPSVVAMSSETGEEMARVEFEGGYSIEIERGDAAAPFSNVPFALPLSRGVAFGSGVRFEIIVGSRGLEVEQIIRWPDYSRGVLESEVEELREALAVRYEQRPDLAEVLIDGTLAPGILPDVRPALGPVLEDDEGRLWVAEFEPRRPAIMWHPEWVILESSRIPVGRVTLPPRWRLLQVRDGEGLFVVSDSLDVEHVYVARIVR